MRFIYSTYLLAVSFLIMGCSSIDHAPNAKMSVDDLQGHWEVTRMMQVDFPAMFRNEDGKEFPQRAPEFEIAEMRFKGFDGCNSFSGNIKEADGKFEFFKGLRTLAACVIYDERGDMADYIFDEAIYRKQEWKRNDDGSYELVKNDSPEYRTWRMADDGQLEILKDGVAMLRAKRTIEE